MKYQPRTEDALAMQDRILSIASKVYGAILFNDEKVHEEALDIVLQNLLKETERIARTFFGSEMTNKKLRILYDQQKSAANVNKPIVN